MRILQEQCTLRSVRFRINNKSYGGEYEKKSSPIVQAGGEHDQYLGRLDLEFEKVDGVWTLKDFNGYLYDTAEVEADSYLQLIIDNYRNLFENVKKAA